MEALEGERSPQEIAWAAREVMQGIADVQPLILRFEDIHWAEPPLLDLIEHLADRRRAPVLILCLARPELLDARPGWGGGRVRSTAIELEPLSEEESAELVEQLLSQLAGASGERPRSLPQAAIDRAEGNPLFVEETIRMLVESGSASAAVDRVPDTLQALIAARIDHLAPEAKTLLQRASVIGRVFWKGALEHLAPDVGDHDALVDSLLQREFLLREPRSSISSETAYRFKHALIREVAYTGMTKLARAQYHARFAEWLHGRTGEELVEIRAHHLDRAVEFLSRARGGAARGARGRGRRRTREGREASDCAGGVRERTHARSSRSRAAADAECPVRRRESRLATPGLGRRAAGDDEGPGSGARARRARPRGACPHGARRSRGQARRRRGARTHAGRRRPSNTRA